MGRNSTLQNQYSYTSQTVVEAVQAGDFVVNTSVGNCAADGSLLRPISTTAVSALDLVSQVVIPASNGSQDASALKSAIQVVQMMSGQTVYYALLWVTATGNNLMFAIYNSNMTTALIPTQIVSGLSSPEFAATAINGGGFIVAYGISNTTKWSEFSIAGALVTSGTLDGNYDSAYIRIVQGTSGNVCVAMTQGYAQNVRVGVISPGSATPVAPLIASVGGVYIGNYPQKGLSLIALENGNFSITYATAQGYGVYNNVISNAGANVTGWRQIHSYGATNGIIASCAVTGGFVVASFNPDDTAYYMYSFNANGSAISSQAAMYGTGGVQPTMLNIAPAGTSGESLMVAHTSGNFITARKSDINLNAIASGSISAQGDGTIPRSPVLISTIMGKAALLTYINGNAKARMAIIDMSQGMTISLLDAPFVTGYSNSPFSITPVNGAAYGTASYSAVAGVAYTNSTGRVTFAIRSSTIMKATPLGVAISPAAAAAACSIVNSGVARIRTTLSSPYSTDATGRAGVRIAAMGNVCNLSIVGSAQQLKNIS